MLYLYTVDVQDFDLEVYELEEGCGEYAAICRKNNFCSFGNDKESIKEFKEFVDNKLAEQERVRSLEEKLEELAEEVRYLKRKLGDNSIKQGGKNQ